MIGIDKAVEENVWVLLYVPKGVIFYTIMEAACTRCPSRVEKKFRSGVQIYLVTNCIFTIFVSGKNSINLYKTLKRWKRTILAWCIQWQNCVVC